MLLTTLAQAADAGGLFDGVGGAALREPALYLLVVVVIVLTWMYRRESRETRKDSGEQVKAVMGYVADSRQHVESVIAQHALSSSVQAKECHAAHRDGQEKVSQMMGQIQSAVADIKETAARMEHSSADAKTINHDARAIQQQVKGLIEMTMQELRQPRVAVQVNEPPVSRDE